MLVVFAFVLAQGIRAYALEPYRVPSGSMLPTIQLEDRVLVEKVTYRFARSPAMGDIVVFDNPDQSNRRERFLIKRVIAVAGQTVDVRDGHVVVDDHVLEEGYTCGRPTEPGTVALPMVVPEGEVWLMGDNRPASGDSRFFGPQPIARIRGRAFWTYWPPSGFSRLQ